MPLDIATRRQQTTTAELHYLIRTAERPARYVTEPPPGVPRWNGIDDPHTVLIEDARGRESEFTLDRNGFALIKAPTSVANFYDPDEIKSVYYPEVERLLGSDAIPLAKTLDDERFHQPFLRVSCVQGAGFRTSA